MVERMLDWVEDTPMTSKLLTLFLCVAVFSLILFQFIVEPRNQRIRSLQETLQSLNHQIAAGEHGDQLERLTDEIARLKSQVALQKTRLGIQMPMEHVLTDVFDVAQSAGVTLTSWKPEEPIALPEMDVSRVTLRLYAEGRYYALARFLEKLHDLPKTLIVQSMDFHVEEKGTESLDNLIHASFELVGFEATEAGPMQQSEPVRS